MSTYKPNLRDAILQGVITGTWIGVITSGDTFPKPVAIGLAIIVSIPSFLLARYLMRGWQSSDDDNQKN